MIAKVAEWIWRNYHWPDSTYVQEHVYAREIPVYCRNRAGDVTTAANSLAP